MKDSVEGRFGQFNIEQRKAVEGILDRWNCVEGEFTFPIVDGPPGTGKTTVGTIAAAKYILENRRAQIAYLSYTHKAVDKAKKDFQSFGFPKDRVVELHHNTKLTNWNEGIYGCDSEVNSASFEDKRRLKECEVLLCTLQSSKRVFKLRTMPRIIIDEFSQVSTPLFFSTIRKMFSGKCGPEGYALLGDPIQLPVISTQPLLKPNIGVFIMQRKPHEPHRLLIQHRMHEDICEAINSLRVVYHAPRIKSGENTKNRDLSALGYSWDQRSTSAKLSDILDPSHPLVIINTDTCGDQERTFGGSLRNTGEAKLAVKLSAEIYKTFRSRDGEPLKPWILSPYVAQIGEIKQQLPSDLRDNCITIYSSQGREHPCVILSFVCNNPRGEIGFLGEAEYALREQTYVACSRAQAKLIVLMSFNTFLGHNHPDFEVLTKTKSAYLVDNGVDL